MVLLSFKFFCGLLKPPLFQMSQCISQMLGLKQMVRAYSAVQHNWAPSTFWKWHCFEDTHCIYVHISNMCTLHIYAHHCSAIWLRGTKHISPHQKLRGTAQIGRDCQGQKISQMKSEVHSLAKILRNFPLPSIGSNLRNYPCLLCQSVVWPIF